MKVHFCIRNILISLKLLILQLNAASFNVNPIQIHLSQENSIEKFEIINHHDEILTVHLKVMSWQQANGSDQYQNSKDVIVVPPIISIGPHEKQLIRVALKTLPDHFIEKAYRLYVTEIPKIDSSNPAQKGLNFSMRVSIPVFIKPLQKADQHIKLKVIDRGENLELKNQGCHFVHIQSIRIAESQKNTYELGRYILPQKELIINKKQIPFSIKVGKKMTVKVNNETINYDVSAAA